MIKVKLSFNQKESSRDFEIVDGELLSDAMLRALDGVPLNGFKSEDIFRAVVNGKIIEGDFWAFTKLNTDDIVVVHPKIHSGDAGQIFKQMLIIGITVVASVYLGPIAGEGIYGALAVAAVTIGASLVLNALIPPPIPSLPDIGGASPLSSSQMYSINGQSNSMKRMGIVPKVYGTHRMFPNVAAVPYTELGVAIAAFAQVTVQDLLFTAKLAGSIGNNIFVEFADTATAAGSETVTVKSDNADKQIVIGIKAGHTTATQVKNAVNASAAALALLGVSITGTAATVQQGSASTSMTGGDDGGVVQYLFCVYDFGLGTLLVSNLQIGETPLTTDLLRDFKYNYVDPNLPVPAQDDYDKLYIKQFQYYKGRRSATALSTSLVDGQTYIVNTDTNGDLDPQEIILDFVAPRGLYGYSSNGVVGNRTVRLEIDFALAGTSDWHAYNDLTHVDHYSSIGGTDVNEFERSLQVDTRTDTSPDGYYQSIITHPGSFFLGEGDSLLSKYILPGGRKLLVEDPPSGIPYEIGAKVFYGDTYIGNIQTVEEYAPNTLWTTLTLDRVITTDLRFRAFEVIGHCAINHFANPPGQVCVFGTSRNQAVVRTSTHESGISKITGASTSPMYSNVRFTPKVAGQYQVRVRRIEASGDYTTQTADDLTWSTLSSAYSVSPVNTDKRHTFLELKVKATNQLNGNIQNLSGICTSVLPTYDGNVWTRFPTSNPAWAFVDLLTGEVNKKSVAVSRLHMDSIMEWADYCNEIPTPPDGKTYVEARFACNFVLDYQTTMSGVLGQIGGSAQASLNIVDGKYGVLIDRLKTTPVQLFTPRNSKDFTSTRLYGPRPDGLRVSFIDPATNWDISEIVAYDNGFSAENAAVFDNLTSFACTNSEQAWRFGRYMIAQNHLRQETINILVDFENLVCTRGDYVQISQDVMRVGGTPCRVRGVSGSVITTDDSLDIDTTLDYGYTYRSSSTGEIKTSTLTSNTPNTFTVDGEVPEVGDLIIIGEVGSIVFDCIVKSISPNDDQSATITLIEKIDAIFDYESTDTFPDYDPQIANTSRPDFYPPLAVTNLTIADSTYECAATMSGYSYFVDLLWDIPPGSVYELFEVWVNDGQGYRAVATTQSKLFRYEVDQARLGSLHGFKIIAVSSSGKKLHLVEVPEVTTTPDEKSTPPSDVESLDMSITNQVLQLSWRAIADCDVAQYVVRYSTEINDVWESSIPLATLSKNVTSLSVQARTGIYLIKAVDYAGNQSSIAAAAITTIPSLFDLNVIDELNDAPGFAGEFDQTELLGEAVILDEQVPGNVLSVVYYSEGYYYFAALFDLGDIYSARLQSNIRADGLKKGELMSEWVELDLVDHLNTSLHSDWDIALQYRVTDTFAAMSSWVELDLVDHINFGSGIGYTAWRDIPTTGDATGRIFQFRAKLMSLTANVTPRLFDTTVKIDMPDRTDSFENQTSSASIATVLTYETAFAGPGSSPNVQVSIDAASTGDYWSFDYKTLDGFAIRFYDKLGVQVVRQFDVAVKGYGRQHSITI